MPRRSLSVCAWAAWACLMPISASAPQGVPPTAAPEAQVEKLLREGETALDLNKLDEAQDLLTQALAAHEALGRHEVRTARILTLLGQVARVREELDQAQAHHDCAFSLLEVVGPDTVEMAHVLNNMGSVARRRDELDRAEEYFQRSLALHEKHAPDGLDVAQVLNNLGALAHYRTDMVAADRYLRRAIAIKEKLAPDSLTLASTLNNLAMVAMYREDMASAEAYARRAVVIKERLAPDSLTLASGLTNLAGPLRRRGATAEAEALVRRGLAIRERLAPESLVVSDSLHQLALLARERGDLEQVESLMHRTLALENRIVPGGLRTAITLRRLAEVALARRRWDDAERHLAAALAISERLQPDSFGEAQTRYLRGRLLRERGRLPEAADELRRAVDALENQIGTLGGLSEDRSASRAQRGGAFYADLVDVLVQLQRAPEAFQVLERSRARGFLEMLTTRELASAERAPEALEAERRRLAWQYDRKQQRLAEEGRTSSAAAAKLQDELRDLRRRHSELVEQIRGQGAGASLRYPQPFDLAQTTAALEPGTLLLSYAVGEEHTHVFAVSREDGLAVQTLSSGREALTKEVELFRRLIEGAASASPRVSQLARVGGRLYQTLLAPLAPRVERCRRVVIVPDGPLHVLPFAALVREPGRAPGQRARYLIEWKPLSMALSATVYGELRQRPAVGEAGPGRAAPTLVAFGDPALPAGVAADGKASDQERSLLKEVTALRPLPAARQEVDGIAALFAGSAEAWVGPGATEERVKGLPPRVRYVHFATHAVLDHVSPMDTTLVLAAPEGAGGGGENGLLQAWEVLELRLEADLVVLSACDSGLGRELRGEGLLSLTRAFQHAGARSVMASLWRVGDPLTAALMVRFYRHLKQGTAADEALRAAQMELIAGPVAVTDRAGRARDRDASLPYHWAAFQLHGGGQ